MGNKHNKDESFRNLSLSRLSNNREKSQPKIITNLRNNQIIQSQPPTIIPKKSQSLAPLKQVESSIVTQEPKKIKKNDDTNFEKDFENCLNFCQDFCKDYYMKNINTSMNVQSNYFNNSSIDIEEEQENFRFKKLNETFNLNNHPNFFKEFSKKITKNEYKYFIELLQNDKKKLTIIKKESDQKKTIQLQNELFPFKNKLPVYPSTPEIQVKQNHKNIKEFYPSIGKTSKELKSEQLSLLTPPIFKNNKEYLEQKKSNQSRSRSFSNNSKDSTNQRGFKIINGHVFSFQNELNKKKKLEEIDKNDIINEESEENSELRKNDNFDIDFDKLDMISQKKLDEFLKQQKSMKVKDFSNANKKNVDKYKNEMKQEEQNNNQYRSQEEDLDEELISDKDLNTFFKNNQKTITEEKIKNFYKEKQKKSNLQIEKKNENEIKKNNKLLEVEISKKEKDYKDKYQELLKKEKTLINEKKGMDEKNKKFNSVGRFKPKTVTVNLEDLKSQSKKCEPNNRSSISNKKIPKKKFFDKVFEDSNKNSKKDIIENQVFHKSNTLAQNNINNYNLNKSGYKDIFDKKKSIVTQLNKKNKFDPVKYLQGDKDHQIYNFPKNKKFIEFLEKGSKKNEPSDILKKFRESGKKRQVEKSNEETKKNLNIDHDSIEYEIYQNMVDDSKNQDSVKNKNLFQDSERLQYDEDFNQNKNQKSDKSSEKESLNKFINHEKKTTLSSKHSSKHHIKVDIRNLSEKVQFSLDHCFKKKN